MLNEYVHKFCQTAKASGIEKLNFYIEEKISRELSLYQGALEHMQRSAVSQVFVEGLVNGKSGSVFLENLDEALIPEYICNLKENAELSDKSFDPYHLTGLDYAPVMEYNFSELEQTVDAMRCAEQAAYDADQRIAPGVQIHVQESGFRYTLADENENMATDVILGGRAGIHLVARDGEAVQPGGKGKPFHGRDLPDLEAMAREAAEGAVSRLHAKSCSTGNYPVVLDSRVVGELLDAFMPAFFAGNIQSHMSVLAGRLGEQLAGENVSILEDPAMPGGFCTRRFDDEGVLCQPKAILDQGKLKCWLYNRQSAGKDGCASGGNGFKTHFNEAVSTGYTNVYIPKGSFTREELLRQMGDGLLITGVSGVFAGARPNSGDFSLISTGYQVEKGEIVRAVNQITIAGNFFEMLKSVQAIGNDEYWMIASNGNVCTPSMRVATLAVSGKE